MVTDQLNDLTLTLSFVAEHNGYIMPHGVAISAMRNHLTVPAYGDNSVIVQPIPGLIQNVERRLKFSNT
jgi:hypothetical protein